MKTERNRLSIFATLLISGSAAIAANGPTVYPIETRLDQMTAPTAFAATQATPVNGAISENVATSTERILNQEAHFLKKGSVQVIGDDSVSAWEMVSDEGGKGHDQTAPNPLTYFAAGAASDLLTQVERSAQILDLKIDDAKVETKIFFRWSDPFTPTWAGYTDKVIANILIESSESPEKIDELKQMALKAWAIGESLANKTKIDSATVINGNHWVGQEARPGRVGTPISIDHGFKLTDITPDLNLQTVDIEEDLALQMNNLPQSFKFTEIGIAESAHDAQRPYLHKIRAKSLTENYATWELYADDSRGVEGIDKAPSSWDYFTLGTSDCLMSQLTANQMYFQKQGIHIDDFRVEHQFHFQQDNFMTPTMTGRFNDTSDVITRILVKSDSNKEAVTNFAVQSLRCCFAGEGIQNETEMETVLYLNGNVIK